MIEGCLKADFHTCIQNADLVLSLIPASPKAVAAVAPQSIQDIPLVKHGIALRIMQGEQYGVIYKLNDLLKSTNKRILTLGRDSEETHNSIAIKEMESSYISRKHCTLEYNNINGTWIIRDGQWDAFAHSKWRESTNGTFVGSKEVSTNGFIINIGDIISVGDVKLRVEGY